MITSYDDEDEDVLCEGIYMSIHRQDASCEPSFLHRPLSRTDFPLYAPYVAGLLRS